jgi:hypothetical protein
MSMSRPRDRDAAAQALIVRVAGNRPPGCLDIQTVVLKQGPNTYKTASVFTFGDTATGEIAKRTLVVKSWNAYETGGGYHFDEAAQNWSCDDDEMEALRAFLSGELDAPGEYRKMDDGLKAVLDAVGGGTIALEQLPQIAEAIAVVPGAAGVLANGSWPDLLRGTVQLHELAAVANILEAAVADPDAPERAFQQILDKHWWIFGGQFLEKAARRNLTVLDQLDVPLIRADGTLHIVELKRANIANLVVPYRSHHIVGDAINEAVGQVQNYLRALDEERHSILANLGIECRRAYATVVIGSPQFVDLDPTIVSETIRTYNSHITRIEVITYADLIAGARQALAIASVEPASQPTASAVVREAERF